MLQLSARLTTLLLVLSASVPPLFAGTFLNRCQALSPVQELPVSSQVSLVLADTEQKTAVPIVCMVPKAQRDRFLDLAIKELADCVFAIVGTRPSIVYDRLPAGPAVVIGGLAESGQLPDDGFMVKTVGDKLYISGKDRPSRGLSGSSSGTRNGIADFLERVLDVRWYFPKVNGGRYTPSRSKLVIPPLHYSDHPRFVRRLMWPEHYDMTLTSMLRHGVSVPGFDCHVPRWRKEYLKSRPEIYQLKSDGTRQENGLGYLCYSHPKTLETYLERIAEEKRGGRKATMLYGNIVGVSPDDAEVSCCCDRCKKLYHPELGQYGNASYILEDFVTRLAHAVSTRYPGMQVGYLAYLNYSFATGRKLPENVLVQICSMPGMAMYKEPAIRASEQANLDRWLSVTGPGRVLAWQYSCWPEDRTPAPFQYPHVVRDFFKHYQGKLQGSFVNGVKNHWSRQHITLYCWYRSMWNPDFDVDAVLDEFCSKLYGPAAKTVRELLRIECDSWEQSRWPNAALSLKAIHEISFPRKTVERMKELTKQAYREIGQDPLLKKRLDFFTESFQTFFQESDQYASGSLLRPLLSQKVGATPTLDGKLDEKEWQRATPLTFVAAYNRKDPSCTYPTRIRSIWTSDGAYFGLHMTEPNPELLYTKNTGRDASMIWHGDNVEMLLDPSAKNAGDFYHFILDAAENMMDSHRSDTSWNCRGVTFKTFRGKDFWSMEIFVPWTEFPTYAPQSGSNTKWTGQFTRLRYGSPEKKKARPDSKGEYTRMNTTFAAFSANLADFTEIKFVE